jgi:hypothetical protein
MASTAGGGVTSRSRATVVEPGMGLVISSRTREVSPSLGSWRGTALHFSSASGNARLGDTALARPHS